MYIEEKLSLIMNSVRNLIVEPVKRADLSNIMHTNVCFSVM